MGEIFKRPFKVRAMGTGKQITVPAESDLQVGDMTTVLYDGFLVVVPKGTAVNEELLKRAIKLGQKPGRENP